MNLYSRIVPALLLAMLLSACSQSSNSGKDSGENSGSDQAGGQSGSTQNTVVVAALPKVLEVFGLGDTVYARSLAVDEKGNALWVGTSAGVHEIDLTSFDVRNSYTRDHGLANEYVFSMFVDNEGAKWFGTNGGGISRYQDGQWQTFFPMHGLADYWVYAMSQQRDGTMWFGTWAGASRFSQTASSDGRIEGGFSNFVAELVNEWVYGVAVDDQDRVWLGTEGGVSMYDGEHWYGWTHEDELGAPNAEKLPISTNTGLGTRSRHDLDVLVQGQETYNPNYVFSIFIDSGQQVWAGTWGGGASYFDGKRWRNLTTKDGLAGNIVYAINEDQQGNMWFATNKGLSRYDGSVWQNIGLAQGLPQENIYALAVTPSGDVWAGARGSVIRIGRQD